MKFLRLVHAEEGFGVSFRNISLSTCGLIPEIDRLGEEELPVTLCISLHAPTQEKRERIMPIAKRYAVSYTHLDVYKRQADILVGTQMIAKGFDFENVTLVGIVAADTMMMEDYRAEERMFTLIEQAAGRAGRSRPGNVFVQTYQPAHYAIMHAKDHDYQGFFMDELVHLSLIHI